MNDAYRIKLLHIILARTRAYVKSYDCIKLWMYFLIEDNELSKNIMIFGIKSEMVRKSNLIVNSSTIKYF